MAATGATGTETVSGVPDILLRICEKRRERVAGPPGAKPRETSRPDVRVSVRGPVSRAPGDGRTDWFTGGADARRPGAGPLGAKPRETSRRPEAGDLSGRHDAPGRRFLDAIEARRGRAVIAEIKMGSPKLGDLRGRFDPVARARTYAEAGAACLSVVVEPDHFFGSYELLAECAAASGLPAVAKDFVVSDVQIEWARDAGASAVLLIAALYDAAELRRLAGLVRGLGLTPLIETHDDADFEKLTSQGAHLAGQPPALGAQAAGPSPGPGTGASSPPPVRSQDGGDEPAWELVGINNRDLRTFEVDLERSADRVGRLPASALKVAESGIRSGADVEKLRRAGFDAFLIGERLVLSGDPVAALAELLGAPAPSPAGGVGLPAHETAGPRSGEPEPNGPRA